jgi:transcription antitermination protein NusB
VARECAVRAIYAAELSQYSLNDALEFVFAGFTDEEQIDELIKGVKYPDATLDLIFRFTRLLAEGVWKGRVKLDRDISAAIPDYDYNRVANVDRNILRVAYFELNEVPYVPPAVTINEAIEMAKKYSTGDSGKFVNGVLATLLLKSPKATWTPESAPQDPDLKEMETIFNTPMVIEDEEVITGDSEQGKMVSRYGVWKLKTSG